MRASRVAAVGLALLVAGTAALWWLTTGSSTREVTRLAELLQVRESMAVAEIGAGRGWLTMEVARRVGPSGRVYATELDATRLDDLFAAAADAGLRQVTVLPAGEHATNLPAGCCDAVFMRRVYHHLSDPEGIGRSIREALRPGGRLVVIDFEPFGPVGLLLREGVWRDELVGEMTRAGLREVAVEDWPAWGHFVAVFERPPERPPSP